MDNLVLNKHFNNPRIRAGFAEAVPIVIGYIPASMAFGLLAKSTGVPLFYTFLFSFMVFAGASQFMALNLIQAGSAYTEIVLATFLLNLRHLLMSTTIAAKLKSDFSKWTPFIAFGVTDEAFSVAATREEKLSVPYLLALELLPYSVWVGGSVLGYVIGEALPASVQSSMGIALYAMFAAIIIPGVKKSFPLAVLALGAGICNAALTCFAILPAGWNIIAATALASAAGALIFKEDGEEVA